MGANAPKKPEPFYKAVTAICGPGDPIKIPKDAGLVACESELVVIIGKEAKKQVFNPQEKVWLKRKEAQTI